MLAVHVGARQQTTEPAITVGILAEQHQTMRFVRVGGILQPDIRPHDGFHSSGARGLVKLDRPEKVGQVRHGHGRHAMTDGGFYQIVRADDAIRQGKLGMDSEMNERPAHGRYLTVNPRVREAEKTSAIKDSRAY